MFLFLKVILIHEIVNWCFIRDNTNVLDILDFRPVPVLFSRTLILTYPHSVHVPVQYCSNLTRTCSVPVLHIFKTSVPVPVSVPI